MSDARIYVLGSLRVSGSHVDTPRISKAVRRLIASIVAAGPDGIGRDELAVEMWGNPLPESWKSALRNRMTAARKIVGSETILNQSGRFCFADTVRVDSWELINHSRDLLEASTDGFEFLEGEPLVDVEPSPLIKKHIAKVNDARVAILAELLLTASSLTPYALQTLRSYQRAHPLEPTLTRHVIRAHAQAGEHDLAVKIVDEVKTLARTTKLRRAGWVDQLDELATKVQPQRRRDDHHPKDEEAVEALEVQARAKLFAAAAQEEDWSLALEVAMAGLPEAERIGGDPERLALLEAIPIDKLDPARKFSCCLALARHFMYAGREEEARKWSLTTRSLAVSPEEQLLAFIAGAIVGDAPDERTPIPLPDAFETEPAGNVNLQSLQVAVMNNLERAPFEQAARLKNRYNTLVEASAEPYRRWHLLLLEAMTHFVEGDLDIAADLATRAYQYAELFGIADAEIALIGQRSNAHWIHPGIAGISDYVNDYPISADSRLSRALQAIDLAPHDGGAAVDKFTRSFNFTSASFFTLPIVVLLAGHAGDPALRAALADRLKKRTGTSAIWGTGVLHLGPVDRILAQLVENPSDQEMHLAAAVQVADRQNMPLWRVVCRLDLAHAFDNQELRDTARELATTPDLEEIAATYQGVL